MREFSAAEDEESFHVFYPGEDEPVVISKWGLRDQPDVVAQIRSRVVPDDAPGHQSGGGIMLANALPPAPMTQEEQDAVIAEQAAYTQASLANEGALESPMPPPPAMDGGMSGYAPLPGGGQSLPPERMVSVPPVAAEQIESTDPSLDVSMPPAQVYRSLLNTEAAPQPLGGVPQTGAGPFQTPYSPVASTTAEQGAVPGVAPAGSAGAGVGAGGREGMGVKQSSERGGAWREADGIGAPPVDEKQAMRDARAAVLANLAGEADKAAKDRDIAVQEQFLKDKAMLEQQNAADIARRDIEAKEMKRQIMEGKIDPTRLFSSMDGGRQAVTLISMVLGGLANGASGFRTGNVAVDMFDRMIDRDIAAQKDGLDRKQSMYRDFIQEGRDAQQAFLLTKAAMQEGLAAQLRLNASKLGSETAMMNAEQNAIAIESAAKANRDKAANDWTKTELDKRMTAAQIAKMRSDAQRQKDMTAIDYMNAQTAATKAGQGTPVDREFIVPVAPFAVQGKQGVRFTAFNKEQANKVRAAGSNAENLISVLEIAKRFRTDRDRAWIPAWLPGGDDATIANAIQARILGALNDQRNYGALDIGSQAILKLEAINPGDILKTDNTIDQVFDSGIDAVKQGYAAALRGQTEEGAQAIPSTVGPTGGRKAGQ